jgi:uncharacterized OB-fold protein
MCGVYGARPYAGARVLSTLPTASFTSLDSGHSLSVAEGAASTGNDPFAAVHDFFHSPVWYLFRNLTTIVVVMFWAATVWWVFRDARRRIDDPWLVGTATLLAIVPLVGPLLYLLVRPQELLADARERELAMRALGNRIRVGEFCHRCGAASDPSFRFCPVCTAELRRPCPDCAAALEPLWQVCPFCGTPSEAAPAPSLGDVPSSLTDLRPAPRPKRATEPAAH